ncbi:hypothetical protein NDK47_11195 [Brevibacillus ruminantium]|uniref:Uncharacterized protein n=1 Tax=Brevibacillus ruminantium TaxID=2950604 RepID=A0ABY4WKV4_9BACL|nr:hypothetical protein [Brevibacillus ruminantium]USG67798.1 hypothetical protein NDK47_11195 [Brevibacillus ruminantium]
MLPTSGIKWVSFTFSFYPQLAWVEDASKNAAYACTSSIPAGETVSIFAESERMGEQGETITASGGTINLKLLYRRERAVHSDKLGIDEWRYGFALQ